MKAGESCTFRIIGKRSEKLSDECHDALEPILLGLEILTSTFAGSNRIGPWIGAR